MTPTGIQMFDGIEVRAQQPLDLRSIVTTREELFDINTWPHDEVVGVDPENVPENVIPVTYKTEEGETITKYYVIYMKEGMRVTVTGTKTNPVFDLYILQDLSNITNATGWKYLGAGGGSGMGGFGNIDGGRADESYTPGQSISGGDAYSRGEIEEK